MIIACPSCTTRFKVPDARIQATGTKVRCANCGHVWLQRPEEVPARPEPAPAPAATPMPPTAEPPAPPELEPIPEFVRQPRHIEPARAEAPAYGPSEPGFAEPAEARAGVGRWALRVGWAVLLLAVISGLGIGYFFRFDIVRSFPKTAALYSLLGLEVNVVGVDFRNVNAERGIENGKAAVQLEGEIVNRSGHRVAVPELHATIRDAAGRELTHWTFEAFADSLGPKEVSAFASPHVSLPAGAVSVEVRFATTP